MLPLELSERAAPASAAAEQAAQASATTGALAEGGVDLLQALAIFALAGCLMIFGVLVFGKLFRPRLPHPEKAAAYECGEQSLGPGWVQFDLRFYVVALVFLIFDVEIALLYPWAVVFGGGGQPGVTWHTLRQVRWVAMWDMLFFFGVVVVGFLYLWRFGYLDWVRATAPRVPGGTPVESAPASYMADRHQVVADSRELRAES